MKIYLRSGLLSLAFFLLASSCLAETKQKPKNFPEALWVPPGATSVNYYNLKEGTQQIFYVMNVCYPAKDLIKSIAAEMVRQGWVRRDEDFLNPGSKLNAVLGEWSQFKDGKGNQVYQWMDDWSNGSGDIVRYGLKYSVPSDTADKSTVCSLKVVGLYIPKSVREKMPKAPTDGK